MVGEQMYAMDANVEFEKQKWDLHYRNRLQRKGAVEKPSLWWRIADDDYVAIIRKHTTGRPVRLLESGSGSGSCSFYLSRFVPIASLVLCDVSSSALKYACNSEPSWLLGKVRYLCADISSMPIESGQFDINWNIGVIEHYPLERMSVMVREMLRVTKTGGIVAVGIPNRLCIATLKAWVLGSSFGRRYLRFIPGYRFDTERLYGARRLARFLSLSTQRRVVVEYAGSLLWVGAPACMVVIASQLFRRSRLSFLAFFIIRK